MNIFGNTGALASSEDRVGLFKHDIVIRGVSAGREQNEPPAGSLSVQLEICERGVPCDIGLAVVVKRRPFQRPRGNIEPGWLDNIDCDVKTCRKAQDCACVLSYIRLIECHTHLGELGQKDER